MIRWIYDLLFTRTVWTQVLGPIDLVNEDKSIYGVRYILQNQWGNIKKVDCK